MAKYKVARGSKAKPQTQPSKLALVPCLVVIVAGMLGIFALMFAMLRSGAK